MGPAAWLPYHRPSIGAEEIAEVVDTLRSGWVTTGPKTKRFEREFATLLGVPDALAVSSGTAALHLALRVLGVEAGDDVIVPAYTFTATAEAVTYLGARPVLADVDPVTCNLRGEDVERARTPRTRAVIPVHIAGLPCDMDPILDVARRRRLAVLEDAAHALPARDRGRWVGTLGDAAAFSFYATKNITTGEGGMLVVRDPEAAARARMLALHGISRDAWKRYTAAGHWRYEILASGYKYNLPDLAASLGLAQLRKLARFHARRRQLAARYDRGLAQLDAIATPPHAARDGMHAWHLYMIRLRTAALRIDRDGFVEELRARNVGTSVHFIPLHLHPYYQQAWGYRPGQFPGAEAAWRQVVSLPLYPAMADDDVDDVLTAVADVVRRHRR
ncbi:MAG TPA: DegT/DnrJ/EryC1/StrS family aminotransferase [Candidatus Binatia bacterium]|nr:DegT/DnrJ/EryC1/StrS family aminotransferase [Candidatus Binatia bacterium]